MARRMLCLVMGKDIRAKMHRCAKMRREDTMETRTVFAILFVLTAFMLVLAQYILVRY